MAPSPAFAGGALAPVLDAEQPSRPRFSGPDGHDMPITSIESYRRTLLLSRSCRDTLEQIRALGGGTAQFSIGKELPDWQLSTRWMQASSPATSGVCGTNFTLNVGIRYETQSNIHDYRDIAPRVAFAWAPGGSAGKRAKTVLRAGFGMFYDRFPLADTRWRRSATTASCSSNSW